MKSATVTKICEALEEQGAEFERREDYSGRYMYGKTTMGIVVGDMATFVGAVARAAVNLGADTIGSGAHAAAEQFVEDVSRVKWDNMGTDIIVY